MTDEKLVQLIAEAVCFIIQKTDERICEHEKRRGATERLFTAAALRAIGDDSMPLEPGSVCPDAVADMLAVRADIDTPRRVALRDEKLEWLKRAKAVAA